MFRPAFVALACCLSYAAGAILTPKLFSPLPLGAVRPAGWLQKQLEVQNNGLGGRQHNFYRYINQTDWLGGDQLYSDLEEAGSYWFNGNVPSAALGNDAELLAAVQNFADYVLEHQDSSGWLGPEVFDTSKKRYLWGRYPFLFGLVQLAEFDRDRASQIIAAMHKFTSLANTMLKTGDGLEPWGQVRWMEFVIALQWLYEYHPEGKEDMLIETMHMLQQTGQDWSNVFSETVFPTSATPINVMVWHGVNVAEALKWGPAAYRFTQNSSALDSASAGWDLLFKYHGRPSGAFAADEFLAGLEATRGTELCAVVELMFSGSYLYQVIGDLKYADRVEKVTYNALPATLTGDMWARQYLQQQNQVAAKDMPNNPFPGDGSYSNVFGLEPNYPCCTVNHMQGWPKFISNAFLTADNATSLVHLYHGPFSTSTTLSGGNKVTVNVDTKYPFGDNVKITINADQPFTYKVRVPGWVVNGSIGSDGASPVPLRADANGLHAFNVDVGETVLDLSLPAVITTESRPHGSFAVHRGPLHYALDVSRSSKVLAHASGNSSVVDYEFDPTSNWQYALNASSLVFNPPNDDTTVPSPVYDTNGPPLSISGMACPILWDLDGDTYATSPPLNATCTGDSIGLTLIPYGATKLRISEFPSLFSPVTN